MSWVEEYDEYSNKETIQSDVEVVVAFIRSSKPNKMIKNKPCKSRNTRIS